MSARSSHYRAPQRPPQNPFYDEERRGVYDPNTRSFRPNIDARARPSAIDAASKAAGTNATGASTAFTNLKNGARPPGWDKTFGPLDRATAGSAGVANPPPMTNLGPGALPPTKPLNVKSEAVQTALDQAAGTPVPGNIPATGASIQTPNGTASVRFASPTEKLTAAQPIMEDGKQIGVGRQGPGDIAALRAQTFKDHPEVFQQGSPQNAAFVAHANKYGELAAHNGVGDLMTTIKPANAIGATGATVKNDVGGAPSAEHLASMESAGQGASPDALVNPNSALGKVASAVKSVPGVPGSVADSAKGVIKSGLASVGFQPKAIKGFGDVFREGAQGIAGDVKDAYGSAKNAVANLFSPSKPTAPVAQTPPAGPLDRATTPQASAAPQGPTASGAPFPVTTPAAPTAAPANGFSALPNSDEIKKKFGGGGSTFGSL